MYEDLRNVRVSEEIQMIRRAFLPLITAALLLAGCGDGPSPSDTPELERRTLEPVPGARIGSLDDPDRSLVAVADLVTGPEGHLWISQPADALVRVFTPEGDPVRTVGGRGEGPGEFQTAVSVGFHGDRFWVTDPRQRRVNVYDSAGEHLETWRMPELAGLPEGWMGSFAEPVAGDRALMLTTAAFQGELEGTDVRFPLRVTGRDGSGGVDVATRDLEHERAIFTQSSGGELTSVEIWRQAFADITIFDVAPGGDWLAVVERKVAEGEGGGPSYRVTRVDLAGDTAFSVDVPHSPVPTPQIEIDSLIARSTRGSATESDVRRVIFIPETLPPVSDVLVGRDGSIWVAREAIEAAETRDWDVFGEDGALEMRVTAPAGLDIMEATREGVWGEITDELDVPYVVRYRVAGG